MIKTDKVNIRLYMSIISNAINEDDIIADCKVNLFYITYKIWNNSTYHLCIW